MAHPFFLSVLKLNLSSSHKRARNHKTHTKIALATRDAKNDERMEMTNIDENIGIFNVFQIAFQAKN